MLNMINQCASVCILNKKDKPLICKKEIEGIMDEKKIDNNHHPYVDLCLPVRGVIGQILKGKNNDERRIRVRVKHKF